MTTSDNEPVFEERDTTQVSGDDVETTHAEPMGDALDEALTAPVAAGGGKRWALAILAALLAVVAGTVIWAGIYDWRNEPYVGVSVLVGLSVGWVLRVITKRSDLVVRLVAVAFTALGIVVGDVVSAAWFASTTEFLAAPSFGELLPDYVRNWTEIVFAENREAIAYVIFGAALVLAYLSAGPQSSGKKKKAATEPAMDDELLDGDEPVADPLADPLAAEAPPPPRDEEE